MTLTNALRTATSALTANAKQVSILSRNISGVGDENYVRRTASVSTGLFGTVRVDTQRNVNRSVYDASILAAARSAGAEVIAAGFDRLAELQDIENFTFSAAGLLQDLRQSVEQAAASPSSGSSLASLVETARTTANALNGTYDSVLSLRGRADTAIADSVANLNTLLGRLKSVNDRIVNGTRIGEDVSDNLDIRQQILDEMSGLIGLRVIPCEDNDIIVLADNGLLLFEKSPRSVSFEPTPVFDASTTGNVLMIDGVPASGSASAMPVGTGRIAGNIELRDHVLPQQLHQLDEIARGLVALFAEQDQTGAGTKPPLTGLFTWSGGPALPPSATLLPGIAGSIAVNPLVDPGQGGDPALVRDGGIQGDADYVQNPAGAPGFTDRLFALASAFDTATTFDARSGLPANLSLSGFAAASLDWLHDGRQDALAAKSYQSELAGRYKQTLQHETGPNLDIEMSHLLEVERSYQATAKLIATVDEMFASLLQSVRP